MDFHEILKFEIFISRKMKFFWQIFSGLLRMILESVSARLLHRFY